MGMHMSKLYLRLYISFIHGISGYSDVTTTINFSTNFFQKLKICLLGNQIIHCRSSSG